MVTCAHCVLPRASIDLPVNANLVILRLVISEHIINFFLDPKPLLCFSVIRSKANISLLPLNYGRISIASPIETIANSLQVSNIVFIFSFLIKSKNTWYGQQIRVLYCILYLSPIGAIKLVLHVGRVRQLKQYYMPLVVMQSLISCGSVLIWCAGPSGAKRDVRTHVQTGLIGGTRWTARTWRWSAGTRKPPISGSPPTTCTAH